MDISLVISTYNRSELLLALLCKLEEQSYKNVEVIVADDGSSDGTPEAVVGMAQKLHYPLQVVTHPRQGYQLARTRNNGARAAQARQLVFLDDDCLPDPEYLASYRASYADDHILTGNIIFVKSFNRLTPALYQHSADSDLWGANFSIPRMLFLDIGGFDEEFVNQAGEDTDLDERLQRMGVLKTSVTGAHVYHLGLPRKGRMPSTLYLQVKRFDCSVIRNSGQVK